MRKLGTSGIRGTGGLAALVGLLALTGCGPHGGDRASGRPQARPSPSSAAADRTPGDPPGSGRASASGSARAAADGPLRGTVIVLDAGHNDGNFQHPARISRQVRAGGFHKACDTTGTETNAGYHEAAFTFDVTKRLTRVLRRQGAKVVLTRTDDHSVGPCVDRRAEIGNNAHADAALSIHADGAPSGGHGFHVMQPVRGAGHVDSIVAPSHRLALDIRNAYRTDTGMPPANYIGTDGIDPRGDMAGLNLSTVPKVLVECGNMRNAGDAKLLSTGSFRQKIAEALAAGLRAYLRR